MKTTTEVAAALNRAADDVLAEINAPDEGARDAINLVINAALHYLDHPDATLVEAIAKNYVAGDDPIDWAHR